MKKVSVISGSVREGRLGIKAAKFIVKKLEERGYEVVLIDPEKFEIPMLKNKYEYLKNEEKTENLNKLQKTFDSSDAFVIVSAEYNHGVPPALKNIVDYFMKEFFFKPSAIVTYSIGPFGGVRVLSHWRAILSELGMPSIPSSFPIPTVQDAFDEEGNPKDEKYNERIKRFLDEFDWYINTFKAGREKGVPY